MPDPPASLEPNPAQPYTPNPLSSQSDLAPASSSPQPQWSIPLSPTITVKPTSNAPAPAPALASAPPQPPPPAPMVSYAPTLVSGGAVVPPPALSFRPVLQFLPMSNPGLTNPVGVQPPGVSMAVSGGVGTAQVSVPQPMLPYQFSPGQPPRPYPPPIPNGCPAVPQGTVPPFGLSRYPSPCTPMVRPPFPPPPPGVINVLPAVSRPQIPGVPCSIIPSVVMPIIPTVTPAEKPQTIVYVGKIASIVENDFILSLLQLCGPVKSWKRAQDPTDGTPKGFGFCEFDSAKGVLRALRLLSKFNIDGQELVLNVNQATKEYLERYVDKQTENLKKLKDAQAAEPKKGEETAASVRENEPMKSSVEDSNKEENGLGKKENNDFSSFGIVTNEDKEADQVALDKLTSMIEERLKTRPLPPPPPPPSQSTGAGSGNLNSDVHSKLSDGDSEMRNDAAEDKNDDEITSETKLASEHDRPERSSPDRSRRYDRRSRDRDRGWDLKREKERDIERYERETERERVRIERERRKKIEEAERQYEECLKEWEYIEREREKQQQYEREREKEREYKRKKEMQIDEDDEDGDSRRRWNRNMLKDKRKRRLREKEDDLADRNKEEEEITEAKRRADEHQEKVQRDALKVLSNNVTNESNVMNEIEKLELAEGSSTEIKDKLDNILEEVYEGASACESHIGEAIVQNSTGEESAILLIAASDTQHAGHAPAKKLGFGLVGSGKRTAVPSVFHEDDDDARKEKQMRPLVPFDYSTEELEAVQPTVSGALSPNLAAAAEFAKSISNFNPKVDKPDVERERSRHFHHKSSQQYRDWGDRNLNRTKMTTKRRFLTRSKGWMK